MAFNYEASEVNSIGYASDRGYSIKITNRDKDQSTKWLRANAHQVKRIGGILAEGSEDASTSARDVHLRHAQMFTDMLYAMNARADGTNAAIDVYASERSRDGHPVTAYAHVRAAIRWSVAQIMPLYADQVMETLLDCGESIAYCVEWVENANRHRLTPEGAEKRQGCWVESSRGWTGSGVLVSRAEEYGMPLDDDDRAIRDAYLADNNVDITLPSGSVITSDDLHECMVEVADKAAEWLNENVAPQGWAFGWVDGEFYLWPDSEWNSVT